MNNRTFKVRYQCNDGRRGWIIVNAMDKAHAESIVRLKFMNVWSLLAYEM